MKVDTSCRPIYLQFGEPFVSGVMCERRMLVELLRVRPAIKYGSECCEEDVEMGEKKD